MASFLKLIHTIDTLSLLYIFLFSLDFQTKPSDSKQPGETNNQSDRRKACEN